MMGTGGATKTQAEMSTHGGPGIGGGIGGVKPGTSGMQMAGGDYQIQVKTGTSTVLIKNPPFHLKDSTAMIDFEPLYPPQEFILEDSLRREAERVAHQESSMNRVVYDCQDPSPYTQGMEPPEGEFLPFYSPTSKDDYTLIFESRFESGNLRRAI